MRSQMASARIGSPILSRQPGTSNCEQKMVDAFLYLASAISSRSLASVSFSGYSNHSSKISKDGFLYNLAYGDTGIETYGLWCNLFGHDYNVETVYTITHCVNPVPPRCLRQYYQVSTCTRCGYSESVLIGSDYINCCP